jgi:hypothetical protein
MLERKLQATPSIKREKDMDPTGSKEGKLKAAM